MTRITLIAAAALVVVTVVIARQFGGGVADRATGETVTPAAGTRGPEIESAGLCPWRSPVEDREALFPGADRAEQHLLILSDLRLEVLRHLGPGAVIDANGIYSYRVFRGNERVGTVFTQRVRGEYGALEYVLAMGRDGRIAGLRLQSLREPDATARALESPTWRQAFVGKTMDSPLRLGLDLPQVPTAARPTTEALLVSLRRLVAEATVAQARGR